MITAMHAILLAWKNSLDILRPHRLLGLILSSFKSLWKGASAFCRSFLWFFAADALLFLLLGGYTATPEALLAIAKNHSFILLLLLFAQSIIWFLGSTFFFLLMRREEVSNDYVYCASHIMKFCQITMLPPLFLMIILYALVSAGGISALPAVPWIVNLCLRSVSLMIIFYWLDTSTPSINSFLSAIERGVNLCFYNVPLIALFIGIAVLLNIGCSHLINYVFAQELPYVFLGHTTQMLGKHALTLKGRFLILCFKYGLFFVELIWTAFMLSIYRRKRHEEYTAMFFS